AGGRSLRGVPRVRDIPRWPGVRRARAECSAPRAPTRLRRARAAPQLTNPAAEDAAALLAAVVADHAGLAALHEHCGHRVRALLGADDVSNCATPSAISSRSADHFSKASSAGQRAWAQSVSPYSTLGGT